MKTLENWTPRRGVSVPCITVLDPEANVLEAGHRRRVRFRVQSGRGADIQFALGTHRGWDRLAATQPHRV
ncbi:MAG: hypothetical protein VX614_00980, partial [Myxococcota bacterium]|nr:hypothetical protein [Myxococcota bacterium]